MNTASGAPSKEFNQQTSPQKIFIFLTPDNNVFIFHSVHISIPPFFSPYNLFIIFQEDGFKQDTDKKSCISLYLLPMGNFLV